MKLTLRPYQLKAVNDLRHAFKQGYKSPILVAPTASGKTVIFSYIAEHASHKGNSVYILVHRRELLLQASKQLSSIGIEHGRIAPGHTQTKHPIQVASVQTLVKRLDCYREPDIIIIDECHHTTAGSWRKIIEHYKNADRVGVTATPMRLDGNGLNTMFDKMVYGPSISDLIDAGYIANPIVYAPPADIDLDNIKKIAGDYEKKELEKRVDKPTITGSAVEHYLKICNGMPAIAYCTSISHANHVANEFNASGIKSACIDGKMSAELRQKLIDRLSNGDISVLTSCDIISEGTDIPIVGAAILLRPTMSLALFLQQCGRVLRLYPGKKHAIILDHVGNCLKHGLPDEDREWSLDGIKKKAKKKNDICDDKITIRQCPKCYIVHKKSAICPNCGFVYIDAPKSIQQVDGELQQIKDIEKFNKRVRIGRARTFEELQQLGKEFGYKPNWAHMIYYKRTGIRR